MWLRYINCGSVKGQVAVEYMIIISIAFAILLPFIVYANQLLHNYREDTKISLAKNSVKKLGENIDWVYSQGEPAKLSIEVYIPKDVIEISLVNNTISFKIRTSSGTTDIHYKTIAPLNGSLPVNAGNYIISLTAFAGHVNISW